MIHTSLATYLALNKIDGFGIKHIAYLEKNHPDITEVLTLSNQELVESGWKEKHIEQWRHLPWRIIEQELTWAEHPVNHLLHWHHPDYPRLLKEIHRPPVILYVRGQLDALNRSTMAIVGTRHPTPYGKENTVHFSHQLAEVGYCIASGLAIGIDGIAHHTALSHPTGTIAVVATGLDQVYPERHKNLANNILENGAVVSEFPFKSPPRPENFPRRNRIISGLSRGVLVIEAALKSGSLITARFAMEQGREVFAIPGIIQNKQTEGCHTLIRQGAVLVNCLEHILEELGGAALPIVADKNSNNITNASNQSEIIQQEIQMEILPENFSTSAHSLILENLDYGIPTSIDLLIERTGLLPHEITTQLLELELLGVIQKAESGGYFR